MNFTIILLFFLVNSIYKHVFNKYDKPENINLSVWADEDLFAQAGIFFAAGFESVSQVMTFLVYELAFNPEIQEKLVEEIKETDRKNDGILDYTAIHEMTYLDMVLSGE